MSNKDTTVNENVTKQYAQLQSTVSSVGMQLPSHLSAVVFKKQNVKSSILGCYRELGR